MKLSKNFGKIKESKAVAKFGKAFEGAKRTVESEEIERLATTLTNIDFNLEDILKGKKIWVIGYGKCREIAELILKDYQPKGQGD